MAGRQQPELPDLSLTPGAAHCALQCTVPPWPPLRPQVLKHVHWTGPCNVEEVQIWETEIRPEPKIVNSNTASFRPGVLCCSSSYAAIVNFTGWGIDIRWPCCLLWCGLYPVREPTCIHRCRACTVYQDAGDCGLFGHGHAFKLTAGISSRHWVSRFAINAGRDERSAFSRCYCLHILIQAILIQASKARRL